MYPNIQELIHTSSGRAAVVDLPKISVSQIVYDVNNISEIKALPETIEVERSTTQIQWLHIIGVQDLVTLANLLKPFNVHPLVIEDMITETERSKIEDYGEYVFFAGRVFHYQDAALISDQIFAIIGENFVITVQHRPLGIFTPVRQRLIESKGLLRQKGADFLAYTLFDCLIDDYFIGFDQFNLRIEEIDDLIFSPDTHDALLLEVHRLKREVVKFRRALLPLRDSFMQIIRGDFAVFNDETRLFIRDVSDHTIHLVESLASSKENLDNTIEIYLSNQSNRLNVQMRILTVVTIIFMPLTLIAGIYGMNFSVMPELQWRYGYIFAIVLMAAIAGILGWIFYKKHWF